mgnify:FL=1
MSKEIPMETRKVIAVTMPDGDVVSYIRGKTGLWYPIAMGTRPYLGSHAWEVYDAESVEALKLIAKTVTVPEWTR